jgi:hypothetical protein
MAGIIGGVRGGATIPGLNMGGLGRVAGMGVAIYDGGETEEGGAMNIGPVEVEMDVFGKLSGSDGIEVGVARC